MKKKNLGKKKLNYLNVFMVWAGGDAARCVLLAAVKWGAGSVAYRELDDAADADTANSSSCLHSAKSPSAGQDFNVAVHLMPIQFAYFHLEIF